METLLSKITDAGLDPSSVSGEEAIIFWDHIRQHVSTTKTEQAVLLVHHKNQQTQSYTVPGY